MKKKKMNDRQINASAIQSSKIFCEKREKCDEKH